MTEREFFQIFNDHWSYFINECEGNMGIIMCAHSPKMNNFLKAFHCRRVERIQENGMVQCEKEHVEWFLFSVISWWSIRKIQMGNIFQIRVVYASNIHEINNLILKIKRKEQISPTFIILKIHSGKSNSEEKNSRVISNPFVPPATFW